MSDLPTPINRNEQYLNAIANGDPSDLPTPVSREEQYLDYIARNGGGGGVAGVSSFNGRTGAVVPKAGDYTASDVGALPADTPIPSVDEVPTENSTNAVQSGGVYSAEKALSDMISDAYDPTATYAVGDYCIYNNVLYRCNTAITTGEAFTPAKWTVTNVGNEIIKATQISANGVTLIKIGNIRIFTVASTASYITAFQIAAEDRPSVYVTLSCIVNNEQGRYHRIGSVVISTNGGIGAFAAQNYNANEGATDVSTSNTTYFYGCGVWYV